MAPGARESRCQVVPGKVLLSALCTATCLPLTALTREKALGRSPRALKIFPLGIKIGSFCYENIARISPPNSDSH